MDSALVATVISVLGAGFLGMLGYFLQALRSDIQGLGTRLDRVEVDLGDVKQSLARVEATLAEHGRQLDRMADQGERIAALEGASAARA